MERGKHLSAEGQARGCGTHSGWLGVETDCALDGLRVGMSTCLPRSSSFSISTLRKVQRVLRNKQNKTQPSSPLPPKNKQASKQSTFLSPKPKHLSLTPPHCRRTPQCPTDGSHTAEAEEPERTQGCPVTAFPWGHGSTPEGRELPYLCQRGQAHSPSTSNQEFQSESGNLS